jgi:hypothetical protein
MALSLKYKKGTIEEKEKEKEKRELNFIIIFVRGAGAEITFCGLNSGPRLHRCNDIISPHKN